MAGRRGKSKAQGCAKSAGPVAVVPRKRKAPTAKPDTPAFARSACDRRARPGEGRRAEAARAAKAGRSELRPDKPAELARRVERVRRGLYELYDDLGYFLAAPPEHRERLRRKLDWPDVGHITSLARALAEEERFAEWARFNRYTKSA